VKTRSLKSNSPLRDLYKAVIGICLLTCATPAPASSETPQQILDRARQRAINQVLESSRSPKPFLRANALETARDLPYRATPLLQPALGDHHPAVRFAALVTAGDLKLTALAPRARQLLDDPSASVRAAALYTLHAADPETNITPIAAMLTSQDPSARGNAAILLSRIGDKSAIPMLKELARSPMARAGAAQCALARIQIAEATASLGDNSGLNAVRAAAFSQFDEVRILAVTMMGRLNDQRMQRAIEKMLDNPPIELQIAAASTLAKWGSWLGWDTLSQAADSKIPTARAQAALALGYFHSRQAALKLTQLLSDPSEQVRLSAAAAILRSTTTITATTH